MLVPRFHLAQVNIAQMVAPLESPVMAGFVAQIAQVNGLAESSPGFVWRFQTEQGDATYVRPFEDATILFNLSVWQSAEALRQYVYRSSHAGVMRDRARWFTKYDGPYLALWWVPAGHIPSVEEAKERLEYLRAHGETPAAFSFKKCFDAPAGEQPSLESVPAGTPAAPSAVSYHNRVFISRANSANGDAGPGTVFRYGHQNHAVWATYEGGGIRFGALSAVADPHGRLVMRYQHLNADGQWRTGRCLATPERLADGRLRLHESWQWTNGDCSQGHSIVEEPPSGGV